MVYSSHAATDLDGRWPKAEKIRRLIPLPHNRDKVLNLLEVGAGSGAIAHYFSKLSSPSFRVTSVDVEDQRKISSGYEFQVYDGKRLPFENDRFDVVISNHVIEHVGGREQQQEHLAELCRVLAPGGYVYLATPSRWQIVEPHFSLPLLSWIPRRWRDGYVRIMRRGERYDCDLLRPVELRRLLNDSGLPYTSLNLQALQALVDIERPKGALVRLIAALPKWLVKKLDTSFPTLIYLIRKPDNPVLKPADHARVSRSLNGNPS